MQIHFVQNPDSVNPVEAHPLHEMQIRKTRVPPAIGRATIACVTASTLKTYSATVQKEGQFVFVAVPFSPREAWGPRPRFHVTGTINGCAVRGCLGVGGSAYFLRLGAAWLRDSGIAPGDTVSVSLAPEGPQEDNMPPDVTQALAKKKSAKAFFDGLPTFYRKNFMRWIESAKKPETRARRIGEMIELLAAGKREK